MDRFYLASVPFFPLPTSLEKEGLQIGTVRVILFDALAYALERIALSAHSYFVNS